MKWCLSQLLNAVWYYICINAIYFVSCFSNSALNQLIHDCDLLALQSPQFEFTDPYSSVYLTDELLCAEYDIKIIFNYNWPGITGQIGQYNWMNALHWCLFIKFHTAHFDKYCENRCFNLHFMLGRLDEDYRIHCYCLVSFFKLHTADFILTTLN